MFAALGRFTYRRRWHILAAWAVVLPFAVWGATQASNVFKGGGFSIAGSPSEAALAMANQRIALGRSALYIVFTSDHLDARGAPFQALEAKALARLVPDKFPYLSRVETFASVRDPNLVSRDRRASIALLAFNQPFDKVQAIMPRIRAALQTTELKRYITGEPAVFEEIEKLSSEDAARAEYYTLPVALFVLLFVFGSVVAAGVPLIGGAAGVSATLGFLFLFGHVYGMTIYVLNTVTMLGLAVGIDYSLLMVGRFREELAAGATTARAVETTVTRAGRSVFTSGVAVVVGLTGLILFQFMALRSMGVGGCFVVAFSVLVSLTLLPALLGVLGPRINRLRLYRRHGTEGRFWLRWSGSVMRHPLAILAVVFVIIAFFSGPALHMRTGVSTSEILPGTSEARVGDEIMATRFNPSLATGILALVTWEDGSSPFQLGNLLKLWSFGQQLKAMPGVSEVSSAVTPPDLSQFGGVSGFLSSLQGEASGSPGAGLSGKVHGDALLELRRLMSAAAGPGAFLYVVVPKEKDNSPMARALATQIGNLRPPPGTKLWVAGVAAGLRDFLHGLYGRFPWVVVYVVCATFLVLLVLLRSLVLPLKAVICNAISIVASFGALVYVFQEGHFASLLGFRSPGYIESTLPVLLFCVLFGVSMDYEVFMLTRMREYWEETHDNTLAVGMGLARTGRVITSAALMIVVVGGAFAFTSIVVTQALGLGLAMAVALDATVVRIMLVPAAMRLFGDWNWWLPGPLERRLPRVALPK